MNKIGGANLEQFSFQPLLYRMGQPSRWGSDKVPVAPLVHGAMNLDQST